MFSLVHGVVLRPLPYRSPGELAAVWRKKIDDSATDSFSYADFLDVRSQTGALSDVGFWTWWTMDIIAAGEPISVQSVRVSANMLSILGVEPAQGRLFRPQEGEAGNDNVVIVSHPLWQGHYGGDPDLLGSEIELDGAVHTVVGIMPQGFRFPYVLDVFRLMLGQGLMLTALGLGLGLAASFTAHRVMSSLVYGVTTTDPLTFASVAMILGAVALLAAYVPARRATRVDPLVALRTD